MKISVWDTYVKRKDGMLMHFDILVPQEVNDEQTVFDYGDAYLKTKNLEFINLNAEKCQFCHIEQASDSIQKEIQAKGFSIIEMENCN